MPIKLKLFLTFFKIGLFTFGGGYAMIPLIQKETVEKNKWISEQDILEIIAIAESTPGPIAINAATFIGYKICGFWGAFLATISVIIPSFVIISVIACLLKEFEQLKAVQYAFWGIRAGVLALIVKALVSMYQKCPKGVISYIIMGLAFAITVFFNVNILIVILGCALFGLISSIIIERRNMAE